MKCIFISCFNAYKNRIEFLEKYFIEKGHECYYITSDFNHIKKEKRNFINEKVIQIQTLPYLENISIKRIISHFLFSKNVIEEITKISPDIIYAMVPPNSLAYFLKRYKKRNNIKLVFDIYDLWPETFPLEIKNPVLSIPINMWRDLRNSAIDAGDVIVTECELFQQKLSHLLQEKETILLYPSKLRVEENLPVVIDEKCFEVCYLGSINNIIDIEGIVNILAHVNRFQPVKLHIIGDGENRRNFLSCLEQADIQVAYYGVLFDTLKKKEIFRRCRFGINMMKKTVCVGMTLKSIEYFEAGLPILNNIQGDTQEIVEEYNVGLNIDVNHLSGIEEQLINEDIENLIQQRNNVEKVYDNFFSKEAFIEKVKKIYILLNDEL